ncbi:nucleotidyltransferase domain-containing protein [Candidatus Nomurabacteria bacterium]|nr:nucleotidyltransferase domain-containing protein [Candidatus Nomurabacteria bacterium]
MNGLELKKIKEKAIEELKRGLKKNLFAIVLTGSVSQNTHIVGWSDIDLLVIVKHLNFNVKRTIARIIMDLENYSNVHHGINVISEKEFLYPIIPQTSLEGKTLQTLVGLKNYPNRLLYSKRSVDLNKIYYPNKNGIKSYSLSNIGMFLLRNRQVLIKAREDSVEDFKNLLKKEIRASLTITKLAVQYFTGTFQEEHREILYKAKLLFPDFNFSVLEKNFKIIHKWKNLKNKRELTKIFCRTDNYIENFTHYVFEKSKK